MLLNYSKCTSKFTQNLWVVDYEVMFKLGIKQSMWTSHFCVCQKCTIWSSRGITSLSEYGLLCSDDVM